MPLSAAHEFPALHKPTARGIFPIFLSLSGTVSECESGEITSSSRPWQGGNENEMNPAASLLCPSAVSVNVTGSRLSIGKKKKTSDRLRIMTVLEGGRAKINTTQGLVCGRRTTIQINPRELNSGIHLLTLAFK